MRVCVVGCGAVGSLFAAHLAQLPDLEVWAYDVWSAHVRAINQRGLRLSGVGELVGRLRARTDAEEIPGCEFGIVAVKSMHTEAAMARAARIFGDQSAVCSVQNGLGNEEIIAGHVRYVIRGTTFPAGHVIEPGHVGWDASGETTIGPFEPSGTPMERVEALADLLTRAGMPTRAREDARGPQWTKVIFNAATNPLGALTRLPHGPLCDFGPARELVSGLVAEGMAVARAHGIEVEEDPERLIDHAHRVAYQHRASMLQDVLARRPTEIDFINGALVEWAERAGVEAPLNRAIWTLVKALERSWQQEEGA